MGRWTWLSILGLLAALSLPLAGHAGLQATGLVGLWRLDETVGPTAADSSGNNYNGNIVGNVQFAADVAPVAFAFTNTQSYRFSAGAANYVQMPSNAVLDASTDGSYTIAAWVKPASVPTAGGANAQYAVLMKTGWHSGITYTDAQQFAMFHWWGAAAPPPGPAGITAAGTWGGPALGPNVWYHVAGIVDLTLNQVRFYLNGNPAGTADITPPTGNYDYNTNPWLVGVGDTNPASGAIFQMDGFIDDVRVYTRVLTNPEISTLAGGGTVGDPAPPAPPPPPPPPAPPPPPRFDDHDEGFIQDKCQCGSIGSGPLAAGWILIAALGLVFVLKR